MIHRIDVHHHLLTPRLVEELSSVGIDHAGGSALPSWKPQDSLAMMDRHGIDVALLSMPVPLQFGDQVHTRDVARSLNEFGAECVARWPQRFGLFATLPLPDVGAALDEIAYAFDTFGADGIGLLSNHAGVYLGDPRLEPVVAELDRRGAVAFGHPTVFTGGEIPTAPNAGSPIPTIEPSLLEFIFDTTRTVASLVISATLKRYPRVRFILSHAGGTIPYVHDRILDARRSSRSSGARKLVRSRPPRLRPSSA